MPSSRLDRFLDTFAYLPWWVSLAFGGFMIVLIKCVAYSLASAGPVLQPSAALVSSLWWAPAIVFSGLAALSKALENRHKAALARHASLQSLRAVPWREFESLVAAYYRTQGFTALENPEPGPDGGVDLVLWKNSQRTLVQCKRFSVGRKVSVQQVREFFGVVVASGAVRGVIITTSEFTPEAMTFGLRQTALELVPGLRFVQMIQGIRSTDVNEADANAALLDTRPPACPRCHEPMVLRKSRHGRAPGSDFWGCPRFPSCRGTRSIVGPNRVANPRGPDLSSQARVG